MKGKKLLYLIHLFRRIPDSLAASSALSPHSRGHFLSTVLQACTKSNMVLHSYGMLLPCGIDKFHGTEYVCCPASRSGDSASPSGPSQEEDDEEEQMEDEDIDEADLVEEANR